MKPLPESADEQVHHKPDEDHPSPTSPTATPADSTNSLPDQIPSHGVGSLGKPASAAASREPSPQISSTSSRINVSDPRLTRLGSSINEMKTTISGAREDLQSSLAGISALPSYARRNRGSASSSISALSLSTPTASLLSSSEVAHADSLVKRHLALLTTYNQIKDVAMGMLALIADSEGRRLAEILEDRGIVDDD